MKKRTLLVVLFAVAFIGLNAQISINPGDYTQDENDFVTLWSFYSGDSIQSNTNQIEFNAITTGTVNYTWSASPSGNNGSGSFSSTPGTLDQIILTGLTIEAGDHVTLVMEPDFLSSFKPIGNHNITHILQWGAVHWTDFTYAFADCQNLVAIGLDAPDLSGVTDLSGMFFQCISLKVIRGIPFWDVSNVTDMTSMFYNAWSFDGVVGNWDVSSVTNMGFMFYGAKTFNQDLSNWDVSSVANMDAMFEVTPAFNQDLGNWTLNTDVSMIFMLDYAGMDCSNYSSTLIGWQANNSEITGRTLGADNLRYAPSAVTARTALIEEQGWTITGDVLDDSVCGGAAFSYKSTEVIKQEQPVVETNISVFPNIAQTSVIIRSDVPQTVDILSMDGKHITQIDVKRGDNRFDLSNLKSGLYLIKTGYGEVVKVIKK